MLNGSNLPPRLAEALRKAADSHFLIGEWTNGGDTTLDEVYDDAIRAEHELVEALLAWKAEPPTPRDTCLILCWTLKTEHDAASGRYATQDHWRVFDPSQHDEAREEYNRLLERDDLYAAALTVPVTSTDGYEDR